MFSENKLVILDADGTTIDAFEAISKTFERHDMTLGDLSRFQKRHNLFKYLGGVKEFPKNLRRQLTKVERKRLILTLTEVYREEASLYSGMRDMINKIIDNPNTLVGVVTRNITNEPLETLSKLFLREGVEVDNLDFLIHIPLKEKKTDTFRSLREKYMVNPALSYVCGDEYKDYMAASHTGMHAMMASYGFESAERLTEKYEIPNELLASTPEALSQRLLHALGIK